MFGPSGRAASSRARALPPEERSEAQKNYLAQLDSARSALRAGDPGRATLAVDEALHGGEKDAEALIVRAEVYRAKGDDDTALADYRAAAREDASYADPHLGIFWIQFERGDKDIAGFSRFAGFMKRLRQDDVPTHVARLTAKVGPADGDCLGWIPCLAKLVGIGREIAPRVLLELAPELF